MSWQRLNDWWSAIWFKPCSPAPLCLYRILFGLLLLQIELVHMTPDFGLYWGDQAMWPIEGIATVNWHLEPRFDLLLLLPPGQQYIYGFFWVMVFFSFCLTIGLWTRLSACIAYACLLSFHAQCPTNLNSGDLFQRLVLFLLCFSRAGDMYSVDAYLERRARQKSGLTYTTPVSSPWAQRLIQMQLSIAYCHTFFCKIISPEWQAGTAVYYATRYEEFHWVDLPFILDNPLTLKALTYGTLVVEFCLWTLIWWRPACNWVIIFGIMLHLGIATTLNLPVFEEVFMITYILFLDPEQIEVFVQKIIGFFSRARVRSAAQSV